MCVLINHHIFQQQQMSHMHSHKFCSVLYGWHLLPFTLATVLRCCCLLPSVVPSVCRKWPTVKVTEAAHIWTLTDWLNIWHSTAFGSVRKFHRSFCVCAHLPHRNCVYLCVWVVASAQGRTQSLLEFICRSLSWFDEDDDNLSVFCQSTWVSVFAQPLWPSVFILNSST